MEQVLTVKAIKGLIKESQQEFKAKIGNGVESGNKTNNGKAYSDAKKRAKDFDGGLSDEVGEKKAKYKKEDFNKTLMDYMRLNNLGHNETDVIPCFETNDESMDIYIDCE